MIINPITQSSGKLSNLPIDDMSTTTNCINESNSILLLPISKQCNKDLTVVPYTPTPLKKANNNSEQDTVSKLISNFISIFIPSEKKKND